MKRQVSVILVTCNSEEYIQPCMNSLFEQTLPFDLLVIDNDSCDRTREILNNIRKTRYFHYFPSEKNNGFGGAINRVFPYLKSDLVIFVNPDTYIQDKEFLKKAYQILSQRKDLTGIAPLLLHPFSNTIDSMGIVYHPFSLRPADLYAGKKLKPSLLVQKQILGCTGAFSIYRRTSLEQLVQEEGYLFDEKYFMYYEDADLAFRLHNKGFCSISTPVLIAYHHRRQSYRQDRKIEALAYYNRIQCLRKNLTISDFIKGFPLNIIWETVRFIKVLFHNPLLLRNLFAREGH